MLSESKVEEGSRKELKNKNAENLAKMGQMAIINVYIWAALCANPEGLPETHSNIPALFRNV